MTMCEGNINDVEDEGEGVVVRRKRMVYSVKCIAECCVLLPYLFVRVVYVKKGQMVSIDMCELSFRFVRLLVNGCGRR